MLPAREHSLVRVVTDGRLGMAGRSSQNEILKTAIRHERPSKTDQPLEGICLRQILLGPKQS